MKLLSTATFILASFAGAEPAVFCGTPDLHRVAVEARIESQLDQPFRERVLIALMNSDRLHAVFGIRLCLRSEGEEDLLLVDQLAPGQSLVSEVELGDQPRSFLVVCYWKGGLAFSELVALPQPSPEPAFPTVLMAPLVGFAGVVIGSLLSGIWSWRRDTREQRVSWAKELYLRNEEALREFLEGARTGSIALMKEAYNKLVKSALLPASIGRDLDGVVEALDGADAPGSGSALHRIEEILARYRQEPWNC